jgi:hypothetical protein
MFTQLRLAPWLLLVLTSSALASPEPPEQRKAWQPPRSNIPDKYVQAITRLFEQGLPDPRGCEYREVDVADHGLWHFARRGRGERGWVLPAREGQPRFVILTDGLVYPVVRLGEKADFVAEIRSALAGRKEAERFYRSHGDVEVAYLLRLGEGELAFRFWRALNPVPTSDAPPSDASDPYLEPATLWLRDQFSRATVAHERGDDRQALEDFRALSSRSDAVRAEFKKRNFDPDGYLEFMRVQPLLLADHERRAREKREPIVCLGPGGHPDAKVRIASLVARLDEIAEGQSMYPGHVDPRTAPLVLALIREGEPALDALLDCLASDTRLTRVVQRGYQGLTMVRCNCLSVREVARIAIEGILLQSLPGGIPGDADEWKAYADRAREFVREARTKTPAERWYAVLASDATDTEPFQKAAELLTMPETEALQWLRTGGYTSRWYRCGRGPLFGESLRKKEPSITSLIRKRLEQTGRLDLRAELAMALADWDAKAAREPFEEVLEACREQGQYLLVANLFESQVQRGDPNALAEFMAYLLEDPDRLASRDALERLARHSDQPVVVATIATVFADPALWVPRCQELVRLELMRHKAFREVLRRGLDQRAVIGSFKISREGYQELRYEDGIEVRGSDGRIDPEVPPEGLQQKVRACDLLVQRLSRPGRPQFELYWDEKQRDQAIATWKDLLADDANWGDRSTTGRSGKPATAEQVKQGHAVFALTGQVRVVPGLKFPVPARWLTLKDHPVRVRSEGKPARIEYEQDGEVVQAEEVFVDGRWRRYYGFVGQHHVATVPADEIAFRVEEGIEAGDGFRVRLVPPDGGEVVKGFPLHFAATAGLNFAVVVRSTAGVDQTIPEAKVRLRLFRCDAVVSRQGSLAPAAARDEDWSAVEGPGTQLWQADDRPLSPSAERTVATIDLRQRFGQLRPGFYRVRLESAAGKTTSEILFSLAAGK